MDIDEKRLPKVRCLEKKITSGDGHIGELCIEGDIKIFCALSMDLIGNAMEDFCRTLNFSY